MGGYESLKKIASIGGNGGFGGLCGNGRVDYEVPKFPKYGRESRVVTA